MQIRCVYQVDFCLNEMAITFACIELPISAHNDRYFFADGFVTVRPITMKF